MIRARRSSSRMLRRNPAQLVQIAGVADHQAHGGKQARSSVQPQITHVGTSGTSGSWSRVGMPWTLPHARRCGN
jgi:hypothetical protein